MIKTLFFAQLAEHAECELLELPHEPNLTARKLVDRLDGQIGAAAIAALRHDAVLLAINKTMADWDTVLQDGDEVGFLPPFSGG